MSGSCAEMRHIATMMGKVQQKVANFMEVEEYLFNLAIVIACKVKLHPRDLEVSSSMITIAHLCDLRVKLPLAVAGVQDLQLLERDDVHLVKSKHLLLS